MAGAPLANKENALADSVLPGRMAGRTLHFGIREHGMGAILNGLVVHGGFRAFGATFFVFSDYMRPAVRLACIMGLPVIYVWTHDSIGLGEDGPTHQPIEHLASLRAMPHMRVIRPADATETVEAWRLALERTRRAGRPRALAAEAARARPQRARAGERRAPRRLRAGRCRRRARRDPDRLRRGGARFAGRARDAERRGRRPRASSRCPTGTSSWRSRRATATRCCPRRCGARVSLEAGATFGWSALVGERGTALGLDRYGASAPAPDDRAPSRHHAGRGRRSRARARLTAVREAGPAPWGVCGW